jgi:hypothetical protein
VLLDSTQVDWPTFLTISGDAPESLIVLSMSTLPRNAITTNSRCPSRFPYASTVACFPSLIRLSASRV